MSAIFTIYSSSALLLLVLVAGAAGLARGFSGFGAALIFMPAASALLSPAVAAPVLLIADNALAITLLPGAWARAGKREVAIMAVGALVGVPLGTLALNYGDPLVLRWIIAITATAMLILLMSGWRYARTPSAPITVGVGTISGLFGGLAQLSGPPVVAYWLTGQTARQGVRANIILFFGATSVLSTLTYAVSGLLTLKALALALIVGPLYGLGLFLGSRAFGLASEQTFRRLCFAMIAISVLASLPVWH
jgi:uncharacterized membrane protein YfcA